MQFPKKMSVLFVSGLSSMSVFAFTIGTAVNLNGTYKMESGCQNVTIVTERFSNEFLEKDEGDIDCLKLPNIQESFNGVARRPHCAFLKDNTLNITHIGNNHILLSFQPENNEELKFEYKNSPGLFQYVKVKSGSDAVQVNYQKYDISLGGLWRVRHYGDWIFSKTEKGIHVSYNYTESTSAGGMPEDEYDENSTGSCNLVKID